MAVDISSAFVLAAGLGTRMRPLTDTIPKPLVALAGRTLLDRVLDRIAAAGIGKAVVNVHYLADRIEQHLAGRDAPLIAISDERAHLLDTGGGLVHALPLLGRLPVLVHNSDTVWIEAGASNLARLCAAFDADRMDGLLLLARRDGSLGYHGRGDFHLAPHGRLVRIGASEETAHVFAGASIAGPGLLRGAPRGRFSLNQLWDTALAAGRLYGIELDGTWMHVGDPGSLVAAEAKLAALSGPNHPGGPA